MDKEVFTPASINTRGVELTQSIHVEKISIHIFMLTNFG